MLDSRGRKQKEGKGVAAEKQKTPVGIPGQGSESPNEGDSVSIVPFSLPSSSSSSATIRSFAYPVEVADFLLLPLAFRCEFLVEKENNQCDPKTEAVRVTMSRTSQLRPEN
jgi:hypothetical protein